MRNLGYVFLAIAINLLPLVAIALFIAIFLDMLN